MTQGSAGRWARAAATSLVGVALVVTCVILAGRGAPVELNEQRALAMAESEFPAATGQELTPKSARQELSEKPIAWPGLADFERHEAKLANKKGRTQELDWNPNCPCRGGCPCPGHGHGSNVAESPQEAALKMAESYFPQAEPTRPLRQVQKSTPAEPVWPGYADFERHEEKVAAESGHVPSVRHGHTQVQKLDWDPKCPCRGGCPCPAHGHGDNIVAAAQPDAHATSELEKGMELGFKMGLKAALAAEEMGHAGAPDEALLSESELQPLHASPALVTQGNHVQASVHQSEQPVMLTGKAENNYIKSIERRFAKEEATLPTAASHADFSSAGLPSSPVLNQAVSSVSSGKVTQPESSANMPWPFKRALPTPYPEPKDNEYRGTPMKKSAVARAGTATAIAVAHAHVQHARPGAEGATAEKAASHLSDMEMITQGVDKKAKAQQHLAAKAAAAQATHKLDVENIVAPRTDSESETAQAVVDKAKADFDARAKVLRSELHDHSQDEERAKNPWMAAAVAALHASKHDPQPPRTVHEREDDEKFAQVARRAHGEIAAAEHALRDVSGDASAVSGLTAADATAAPTEGEEERVSRAEEASSFRGLPAFAAHLRGIDERAKALGQEVAKDKEEVKIMHRLVRARELADTRHPEAARSTQLADFKASGGGGGWHDADARALGFKGLSELEAHISRYQRAERVREEQQQADAVVRGHRKGREEVERTISNQALARNNWRDRQVRVRALGFGGVGSEAVRALGGGGSGDAVGIKGRVNKENAQMRLAVKQAAWKKAQEVGRATALALGFDGVRQFAAHLEREALVDAH